MRRLSLIFVCAAGIAHAQPPATDPPAPPLVAPTDPEPASVPPVVAPPPVPPESDKTPDVLPARSDPAAPSAEVLPISPAHENHPPYPPMEIGVDGFLQTQFRMRQDSPAQFDENGFRFNRARFIVHGKTHVGEVELTARIEAELQPIVDMVDAFVTATHKLPNDGQLSVDLGQMRVPLSRQQLLSESRLAFVDRAQIATIVPRRDLGARIGLVVPKLPQVQLVGGVFNGEGTNQVQNINQKFLYAGRLEVTPLGKEKQFGESSFGGDFLTAAVSVGLNKLTAGTRSEDITYLGFDLSGAYKGLSGTIEYLVVDHAFTETGPMTVQDYRGNGFVAQLSYMLPVELPPLSQGRIEVGVRIEEIDRNDTVPIGQVGEPEQSVRESTGVLSLYLRKHSLKAQLAFSHFQEIETETSAGENAVYDNDQLLLQVTCRLE